MSLRILIPLLFLNSFALFSQEKNTKHIIQKGETISSIAEKYEVKQSAIFKLNPNAKKLLKLNSVLLIPTGETRKTEQIAKKSTIVATKEYEVQPKESLYAIAKQYGISVQELKQVNPMLANTELQIGQKINIPANAIDITSASVSKKTELKPELVEQTPSTETVSSNTSSFVWEVLPKETKYSITKKYGISIKEFDKANPTLGVKALRVGQQVIIPTNAAKIPVEQNLAVTETASQVVQSKAIEPVATVATKSEPIVREVLPKETKYAIAKQYGITVQELENQNPSIKNGLRVGFKLNIIPNSIVGFEVASTTAKDINIDNTAIESNKIDFNNAVKPTFNHEFLDQLIERASENIGTRYRSGGTSKEGFDCSGLMCNTFGSFDIKLPRTSLEQSSVGVKINTEEAQKGDLIFFKTNGRRQINHVGMVVEVCDGEIKFIHSSTSNGVIISSTKEKYYERNFSQINRVVQ